MQGTNPISQQRVQEEESRKEDGCSSGVDSKEYFNFIFYCVAITLIMTMKHYSHNGTTPQSH